jgi:hypothetical protein
MLLDSLRAAKYIVASLHPEKPAQARVVAGDLSEYTGGQSLWLRSELRAVDLACTRDEVSDAAKRLQAVQELLRSHGSLRNGSLQSAANRS